MRKNGTTLVVGASGGIGSALVAALCDNTSEEQVVCVSRNTREQRPGRTWIKSDYSAESIQEICAGLLQQQLLLRRVFICCGTLHGEHYGPEKRMESIEAQNMLKLFEINTVVPMLWLKHLLPNLSGPQRSTLLVCSARVGSITDNRLGGWYSYRASKAALNMAMKTAAIECARRAKGLKLITFHPGTTDTALSRPFQAAVPEGKLFRPDFVAQRMIDSVNQAELDGRLSYIDWDGETIPW